MLNSHCKRKGIVYLHIYGGININTESYEAVQTYCRYSETIQDFCNLLHRMERAKCFIINHMTPFLPLSRIHFQNNSIISQYYQSFFLPFQPLTAMLKHFRITVLETKVLQSVRSVFSETVLRFNRTLLFWGFKQSMTSSHSSALISEKRTFIIQRTARRGVSEKHKHVLFFYFFIFPKYLTAQLPFNKKIRARPF